MAQVSITTRSFLIAFALVAIFNSCLLGVTFAQTSDWTNQKTLHVDVLLQQDSPLHITVSGVDNFEKDFQIINLILQNTGSKSIIAYVETQKDSVGTGQNSTSYCSRVFVPGQTIISSVYIERPNIKPDSKVSLSIDYVQFVDGSSWGEDTQEQSGRIFGYSKGFDFAISTAKRMLAEKQNEELSKILLQEITEIIPPVVDQTKPEMWRRGFITGYKSVFSRLQKGNEQNGIEGVANKLAEIEKISKEGKQMK